MQEPTILRATIDASMRIPVDLTSDLDATVDLLTEHVVSVSIESPNPPRTLVNAIAVVLDTAARALLDGPPEGANRPVVIQTTDENLKVLSGPPGAGVMIIPPSATFVEFDLPRDASL